jgi:hypothetical protein
MFTRSNSSFLENCFKAIVPSAPIVVRHEARLGKTTVNLFAGYLSDSKGLEHVSCVVS